MARKCEPLWVQKVGMEWMWRMLSNPKRLVKRYATDLYYLVVLALRQRKLTRHGSRQLARLHRSGTRARRSEIALASAAEAFHLLRWAGEVEMGAIDTLAQPPDFDCPVFLDASEVTFIDSSGIGQLAKLAREARAAGVPFGLIRPSVAVESVIQAMHLGPQFPSFDTESDAFETLVHS